MKLKNKKTGEIIEFDAILPVKDVAGDSVAHLEYDSLAELNSEWEDYEEPKEYWFIDIRYPKVEPKKDINLPNCMRKRLKEIGNYFESEEEAELAVRKLKAWKRLKDKGFRFEGRNKPNYGEKFIIECSLPKETLVIDVVEDLDLLFGGEE